ncbi:MAG: helix-turn-helix domain-containing protein [Desulfonatronovibrio sp.]
MELLNIGEELKAARELQEISLEKVHEDTRIGIEFLKSLEQGQTERMPHPVYARGFVRIYANYLGLDGEQIVENFSRLYHEEDHFGKINPDELPLSLKNTGQRSCLPVLLKTLAFILILALALSAGWYLYLSYNSEISEKQQSSETFQPGSDLAEQENDPLFSDDQPQDIPSDDIYLEQSIAPEIQQENESAPGTADNEIINKESASEESSPRDTDEPVVEDFLERATQSGQEGPVISDSEEQNQAESEALAESESQRMLEAENDVPAGIGKSNLVIRSREDCWLQADLDDDGREVYLRSGESIALEFENSARITLGNAGGVDVYLNGESYPFEASSGEVKTLEFSASDLQPS